MGFGIVLYLCSIFGTSLGFWKIYSKDQEKKTKNASGYKVCLLGLSLLLSCLFFSKTYRVATLKNIVTIKGYKGSFDETGIECKDTISNIIFFTKFLDKKWQEDIHLQDMNSDLNNSGVLMYVKLNNDSSAHHYYFEEGKAIVYDTIESRKHMYEVTHAATTIPTLFPFSSPRSQSFISKDSTWVSIISHNTSIDDIESILTEGSYSTMPSCLTKSSTNLGTYSSSLIYTNENPHSKEGDYWFQLCTAYPDVNKLSVLSLADLSQCNFEFRIKTDIPIYSMSFLLDVPAEFGSLDITRDKVNDNGFTLTNLEYLNEKGGGFLRVHAHLPTQENLQLIRSLILTTIVTALLSMFLSNFYYYCRKVIKERQNKNKCKSLVWRRKLRSKFFWSVVAKRLALFVFFLLAIWIIMLSLNILIRIPEIYLQLVRFVGIFTVILITALIISVTYYGYRRFILLRENKINAGKISKAKQIQRKQGQKTKNQAETKNRPPQKDDTSKTKNKPHREKGTPKVRKHSEKKNQSKRKSS